MQRVVNRELSAWSAAAQPPPTRYGMRTPAWMSGTQVIIDVRVPVIRPGRQPPWRNCSPTGCGCSAPTTPHPHDPPHAGLVERPGRRPAGAAAATEKLLTDQLRVLCPDHPDTLATRHNLASWRGRAGDPAGAAD